MNQIILLKKIRWIQKKIINKFYLSIEDEKANKSYLYDLIGDDQNEIIDDLGNEINIFVNFRPPFYRLPGCRSLNQDILKNLLKNRNSIQTSELKLWGYNQPTIVIYQIMMLKLMIIIMKIVRITMN